MDRGNEIAKRIKTFVAGAGFAGWGKYADRGVGHTDSHRSDAVVS